MTRTPGTPAAIAVLAAALLSAAPAGAQGGPATQSRQSEELAKKLSNPVADLVSVPVQFNWENGVGGNDDLRFVMNVQPVVPVPISDDWNLIGRFILPFVAQPAQLAPGSAATFGTGDIVMSAFFSPVTSSFVWGVGPVFGIPTSTDPLLGSGKWSAGPTGVVLKQAGPWTFGALANHLWSFADSGDAQRADVSQTFLQPFLSYTTPTAVTYTLQSESTHNWEAADGQEWTVPVNALVSRIIKFGPFPLSVAAGAGYYVESPDGGPEWKLRLAFTLILPREK